MMWYYSFGVTRRVCDCVEELIYDSIAWDRKLRPGGRRSGEGLPTLYSVWIRLAQSYGTAVFV